MSNIRPTRPERLLINRRRLGLTQAEAARMHGVPVSRYNKWEKGHLEDGCPDQQVGVLRPHEACLLARRRSGLTQERVSQDMDVCRWWVNNMERGLVPCDSLVAYWQFRQNSKS